MAKIRIKGDTSGYVDIQVPAVAGATTISTSDIALTNQAQSFTGDVTVTGSIQAYSDSDGEILIGGPNAGSPQLSFYESDTTTKEAYIKYDGSTNNFILGTSGAGTAISIARDTGYINMPNQPAFRGENAGDTSFSTDIIISTQNTWTAPLNRGSVFDISNGRFTAPVDGVYLISYGITVSGTTDLSGDGWSAILYKNGTAFSDQEYNYESGSRNGEEGHSGNTIAVELSANDYLQVGTSGIGGSTFIFRYVTLSGFLIG